MQKEIKILRENFTLRSDYLDIYQLKFLEDNPRVYALVHAVAGFADMPEEQKQEVIYKMLLKEPSVKNLEPQIKRHGGLMESILVRHDTMQVIEGNSRLAVYRKLHEKKVEGEWDMIQCDIVSELTEEHQAAFLAQIHIKGKTSWTAYEKANFAYVRYANDVPMKDIVKLFDESEPTIRRRIKAIEMMKQNEDTERDHFSYYDVLVSSKDISREIKNNDELKQLLLQQVLKVGKPQGQSIDSLSLNNDDFTAKDLRDKLPHVLNKPKVLRRYMRGEINLDVAYQSAKPSVVEDKVKRAFSLLEGVENDEVSSMASKDLGSLEQHTRKLYRVVERIKEMVSRARENARQ